MARASLIPVLAIAVAAAASAQSPALRGLSISDHDATELILSALMSGTVRPDGPPAAAFRAASAVDRAVLVHAAVAFARRLTGSAEFAQRYAIARASQRPAAPAVARTGDEARAEQQRQMALAVQQAQERAAQMPPDLRRQLDAEIEAMKRQIDDLNADPEYRAAVDAATRDAAAQADADYADKLRAFDGDVPPSPRVLIARRLQQFLSACADVDFSARLQQGPDRIWRFVDPAHEQRPAEWKLCYRAGKPAVDAARLAAQEWLKELVQ